MQGNTVTDTRGELDDFLARSSEYIRQTYPYTGRELLEMHEVEFFRTLHRVEQVHRDRAREAEERKAKAQQQR